MFSGQVKTTAGPDADIALVRLWVQGKKYEQATQANAAILLDITIDDTLLGPDRQVAFEHAFVDGAGNESEHLGPYMVTVPPVPDSTAPGKPTEPFVLVSATYIRT